MKIIIFIIVVVLSPLSSYAADDSLIPVSVSVTASDVSAQNRISQAITERLKMNPLLIVTDELAQVKIFIYAHKNTSENINPDGWSFAVAHINNFEPFYLATHLMDSDIPEIEAVKPVIVSMVRGTGFLSYLNVAHLDNLDDEKLAILADSLVSRFVAQFE